MTRPRLQRSSEAHVLTTAWHRLLSSASRASVRKGESRDERRVNAAGTPRIEHTPRE